MDASYIPSHISKRVVQHSQNDLSLIIHWLIPQLQILFGGLNGSLESFAFTVSFHLLVITYRI